MALQVTSGLGLRAMIGGSIACMLTGCVAGMLID
jgi:nucleoside permease NupC